MFHAIDFVEEESPLNYPRVWGRARRLSLRDTDAPPPKPDDTYYVPTMTKKVGGKRREKLPGASPGVVAFADYHLQPDGAVYIDYIHVRHDQQRRGHACRLVDRIYEQFASAPYIDFGEVAHDAIEKLCRRKKEAGKPTHWKRW